MERSESCRSVCDVDLAAWRPANQGLRTGRQPEAIASAAKDLAGNQQTERMPARARRGGHRVGQGGGGRAGPAPWKPISTGTSGATATTRSLHEWVRVAPLVLSPTVSAMPIGAFGGQRCIGTEQRVHPGSVFGVAATSGGDRQQAGRTAECGGPASVSALVSRRAGHTSPPAARKDSGRLMRAEFGGWARINGRRAARRRRKLEGVV